MALEEEIVEWAQECPAWHRHALRRLAHGESLGVDDYKAIAERLAASDPFEGSTFTVDDMPGMAGNADHESVRLVQIREVAHVNALVPDQTLTIGLDGLTVVYGDNASGKSGYARLAKRVVRARHHEEILTNVFTDRAGGAPTADLTIDVNSEQRSGGWPDEPLPELGKISFFDAACSSAYISNESEITYRPSALFVLDGLIRACDGVRVELDSLLAKNTSEARPLPELDAGTAAAAFLHGLTPTTTLEQVDAATGIPPDVGDRVSKLVEEELRLRATDPSKERARLQALASKYERVRNHMSQLADRLGDEVAGDLAEKLNAARGTSAAAQLASSRSFEGEPLSGVASRTWRELWDAARAYSETECYDGIHFPVTEDGARCVLCHQELAPDASDRLRRFDAFVEDRTQQAADTARAALSSATSNLRALQVSAPDVDVMLADLEAEDPSLVTACREAMTAAKARHEALLSAAEADAWAEPEARMPVLPVDGLVKTVTRLHEVAASIDPSQFNDQLNAVTTSRVELESRQKLAAARDDVLHEIDRRSRRLPLDAAKKTTDTSRITRKSTELTRSHVTSLVRDWFTRESDRLKLERVTLEDHGGQKGQLRHRPAFVGAVQRAALPQVLSEGEQTALGLAGFFTEVHFDESRSAIILDDPVCSLDHVRREYVANRLAELAQERQVSSSSLTTSRLSPTFVAPPTRRM